MNRNRSRGSFFGGRGGSRPTPEEPFFSDFFSEFFDGGVPSANLTATINATGSTDAILTAVLDTAVSLAVTGSTTATINAVIDFVTSISATGSTTANITATVSGSYSMPSSVMFDLDATQSASYDGSSQTWANLQPSPSDGAGQTEYDYHLGSTGSATTDDPTFTGTSGDSAAYFSMDGGDSFYLKSEPAEFSDFNVATGAVSIAVCLRTQTGANQYLIDTNQGSTNKEGMYLLLQPSGDIILGIGSTTNGKAWVFTGANLLDNTDYYIVLTVDNDTEAKLYINGTLTQTVAGGFTGATGGHRQAMCFGESPSSNLPLTNGTRVYSFMMADAVFTQTEVDDIQTEYEARHGRSY